MKILLVHFYPEMKIGGYVSFIYHFTTMMSPVAQIEILTGSKLDRIQTKHEWLEIAEGYDLLLLAYPGHTDEKYYRIMPDSLPWAVVVHQPKKWTWARFLPGLQWQLEMCHVLFLRKRVRDMMLPKFSLSKSHTVLNTPFNSQYLDTAQLMMMKSQNPPIALFPSRFTTMKRIKGVLAAVPDIEAKVVFASKFARTTRGKLQPDDLRVIPLWPTIVKAQRHGAVFLNGFENRDKPALYGKSTICIDTTQMPGAEGSVQTVTLEAMQYGAVPVMFREWEDTMVAGRNFEPIDDMAELAPAINSLCKDQKRICEYVRTNMDFINRQYSYEVLRPQYLAYFEAICR